MADQQMWKALSVGRPWVLGIQNQVVQFCGTGVCDSLLQNSVSALEPFRYSTVLFDWTLAASNAGVTSPVVAGGNGADLLLSPQTVNAFDQGVGEPIAGGWWNNTISDTDLFTGGAPIDRGFMFLATGVQTEAPDPFQRGGTFISAADPKLFSNWMQESHNGPGYSFLIQKAHLNYTAMQVQFGDQGTLFRIGTLSQYPQYGGPAGAQTVRNGLTSTPGMYTPFTTAICLGSRDDVKKMSLQLSTGQAIRIQNNPAQPTISGLNAAGNPDAPTTHTINTQDNGLVKAPVRVSMVGYIVCVPFENYCGIPTLTPDEIQALRANGLAPARPGAAMSPPAGANMYTPG